MDHLSVVDESSYTGETVEIHGVCEPWVKLPTAKIKVMSPKFFVDEYLELEVGVARSSLPMHDVHLLLGISFFVGNPKVTDIISVVGRSRTK